jgi:hypothetical protein
MTDYFAHAMIKELKRELEKLKDLPDRVKWLEDKVGKYK